MSEGIEVLLFDVGGVLLSNGWDRSMRQLAATTFGLDWEEFEDRHELVVDGFEKGKITLDEYLVRTVFHRKRSFTSKDFERFMKSQSRHFPESIGLLRSLTSTGRYLLGTLNNESRELNDYRIATFQLGDYFSLFLSSCYLGLRKPDEQIYRMALDIIQRRPENCLFIDDRAVNLECAGLVGIQTIQFHDAAQLKNHLEDRGVNV